MIVSESSLGSGADVRASWRGWLIWFIAALFYLYEFFVRVAPSTMEPQLQEAFRLSAAGLGAAMGVYYVIYSPMQLVAGGLLDRFGAKLVLVPAAAIVALGCVLEVAGHSPLLLSASRFMQGFGSAFAFVGTMYLAAEWFPRSMLALLSGLTTSLGMTGAILGNAGISEVVDTLGWHSALVTAAGVGAVVTVLILFVIPHESRARKARAEAVELERGPSIWRALWMVGKNPQSWFSGIVGTALYMPLSVLGALWGQEFLQAMTGATHDAVAGAVSMLYVGWLVGGPLAGWFSDQAGVRRNLLLVATVLTLLTTLLLALVPSLSISAAYVLMLVLGIASCSEVVCFVVTVEHNSPKVAGTAIAATNMLIMLLGGTAEWLFGAILDMFGTAPYPEEAYRRAFLLLPGFCVIGLIGCLFLKESYQKVEIPHGPEPTG